MVRAASGKAVRKRERCRASVEELESAEAVGDENLFPWLAREVNKGKERSPYMEEYGHVQWLIVG